jgi:hypothetical protein
MVVTRGSFVLLGLDLVSALFRLLFIRRIWGNSLTILTINKASVTFHQVLCLLRESNQEFMDNFTPKSHNHRVTYAYIHNILQS